jgi:Flp pilus assembly pilin Flp
MMYTLLSAARNHLTSHPRQRQWKGRLCERGQATVEYALILLVAAVIALLVVTWATAGGGAGRIGGFFDTIINRIIGRAADMF